MRQNCEAVRPQLFQARLQSKLLHMRALANENLTRTNALIVGDDRQFCAAHFLQIGLQLLGGIMLRSQGIGRDNNSKGTFALIHKGQRRMNSGSAREQGSRQGEKNRDGLSPPRTWETFRNHNTILCFLGGQGKDHLTPKSSSNPTHLSPFHATFEVGSRVSNWSNY